MVCGLDNNTILLLLVAAVCVAIYMCKCRGENYSHMNPAKNFTQGTTTPKYPVQETSRDFADLEHVTENYSQEVVPSTDADQRLDDLMSSYSHPAVAELPSFTMVGGPQVYGAYNTVAAQTLRLSRAERDADKLRGDISIVYHPEVCVSAHTPGVRTANELFTSGMFSNCMGSSASFPQAVVNEETIMS